MDKNLINPLISGYGKYIKKINESLLYELQMYKDSEFIEPLKYALNGGKRIRPIILILSAESFGRITDRIYTAASAIELLHTESIIHDDIIDNENGRRNKEPFHIKFGYNTGILTGDFVLGLILNISSKLNDAGITKNLANTAMFMSEGEMLENRLQLNDDITFEDYIKVIEYKTASTFEVAARLGAIMNGGNRDDINSMSEYGKNIGIAYQLRDDLHDWNNEEKIFNLLIKNNKDPRNVFDYMEELINKYSKHAQGSLKRIKNNESRSGLEDLIKFTMFKA